MKKHYLLPGALLLILLLLFLAVNIRFAEISGQRILLFQKNYGGSASAGQDMRESFSENGKDPARVYIRYIGSNRSGDYYLCEYTEADGSVTAYYGFDDGDLNSRVRAMVYWDPVTP